MAPNHFVHGCTCRDFFLLFCFCDIPPKNEPQGGAGYRELQQLENGVIRKEGGDRGDIEFGHGGKPHYCIDQESNDQRIPDPGPDGVAAPVPERLEIGDHRTLDDHGQHPQHDNGFRSGIGPHPDIKVMKPNQVPRISDCKTEHNITGGGQNSFLGIYTSWKKLYISSIQLYFAIESYKYNHI